MSHKAEAAGFGSVPIPPWSALVVIVLNKSMVCQSQGGKQKDSGPLCQLFFKLREKHVLIPSAWVWRLSNLPSQGSRSGDEDESAGLFLDFQMKLLRRGRPWDHRVGADWSLAS